MKRLFLPVLCVIALAGCRRQAAPTTGATTGAASPPAGTVGGSAASGPPGSAAVKPVPATLPEVLATVNGERIERWELESALKQVEANAGSPVPADQRDGVLRGILDELLTYHLFAQECRARKIEASDDEIDERLKAVRQRFPTDEAFQQALANRGLTLDRLRQQERRHVSFEKLVDLEVTSKISVQDADVEAFYQQNIERFTRGETVHASHIFVAVPKDADAAQRRQARAKARQILEQVRAGTDFATLARRQSDDSTGSQGGDLGFFSRGEFSPDFETVAFALKTGETSDVVELSAGFHIIKVHERRPPHTTPLAEVRKEVKAFMIERDRQIRLDQFTSQTKAKSKIAILV